LSVGDLDADGISDLLIGGNNHFYYYVMLGATIQAAPRYTEFDLGHADYRLTFSPSSSDQTSSPPIDAHPVSFAGDVNADGCEDILIGDSVTDEGSGRTWLVLGATLSALPLESVFNLANADYAIIGLDAGEESGKTVAPCGDLDADGKADFIVGAWQGYDHAHPERESPGRLYVFLGSNVMSHIVGTELTVAEADYTLVGEDHHVGETAPAAGDVDGDGIVDIIYGAYEYGLGLGVEPLRAAYGKAYIMCGATLLANPPGTILHSENADYMFTAENASDRVGGAAACADINADGVADVVLTAYQYPADSGAGKTYLIYGNNRENRPIIQGNPLNGPDDLVTLQWNWPVAATHTVYVSSNLLSWELAPAGLEAGQQPFFGVTSGGTFTFQDIDSTNVSRRFYRISVQEP
jgi:hypothetical protein